MGQKYMNAKLDMDDILGAQVEPNKTKQQTKRRVLEDGDPELAP